MADKFCQDRQYLFGSGATQRLDVIQLTLDQKSYTNDYNRIRKSKPTWHTWHTRCYIPTQRISVHQGGSTAEEEDIPDTERNFINP